MKSFAVYGQARVRGDFPTCLGNSLATIRNNQLQWEVYCATFAADKET